MSIKYLDNTATAELVAKIKALVATKQDALVSGTNIKTINNTSILGSGNINISSTAKKWTFGGFVVNVSTYNHVIIADFEIPATATYNIYFQSYKKQTNGNGGFGVGVLNDYSTLNSGGFGGWFPNGSWKWREIWELTKVNVTHTFNATAGEHLLFFFGQTANTGIDDNKLRGAFVAEITQN